MLRRCRARHLLVLVFLAVCGPSTAAVAPADASWLAQLPTGDRWLAHLTSDLLPFWSMPAALGDPLGAFPSTRCDDGSLIDYSNPCVPIKGNDYLLYPARYLVPLSRQTYGYGVAYHLTGDPKYLAWMKAGIDYIRANAIDRTAGGMFLTLDLTSNQWGPEPAFRDPQQLGYGLLSLGFYYYLTRDEDVFRDILAIKHYIFDHYFNSSLGTMQWLLANNGGQRFDQKNLVADLDQMNTYLVLLAPIVPDEYRDEWTQELTTLSHSILATFYSPRDNLMFLAANQAADRDIGQSTPDFGHTSKALWMMRWTGLLAGDDALAAFAAKNGRRLFDRAFIPEDGSWAEGVLAGGAADKNKNWWVYDEIDQYAATLALVDLDAGRYLPQTNQYWFDYFVDHQYGEVWNGVDYGTNAPQRYWPKSWQWKSAYHDFEHSLVGYITSQILHGEPVVLHYAFRNVPDPQTIHPYFFRANIDSVQTTTDDSGSYQTVTFRGTQPSAAPTLAVVSGASFMPVPLPPESIASAFGIGLATTTANAQSLPLPFNLGGASVTVTDWLGVSRLAPLFYVSPGQVNFQVPEETALGSATVTVTADDATRASTTVQISLWGPGVFQQDFATVLAAADVVRVHGDGTQVLEHDYSVQGTGAVPLPVDLGPASDRIYLSLYATGLRAATAASAIVGGQAVPVTYAGAQGYWVGLDQVNIGPLPRSLSGAGRVNIVLTVDGQTAAPVEIVIK